MAEGETYDQQEYAQFDGQNGQYDESAAYSQQMEGQESTDAQAAGDGGEGSDANEDERWVALERHFRIINEALQISYYKNILY